MKRVKKLGGKIGWEIAQNIGQKIGQNLGELENIFWIQKFHEHWVTQLVEDYFVQKVLYSNEFFRIMDIRSDQQQLHESLVNRLRM